MSDTKQYTVRLTLINDEGNEIATQTSDPVPLEIAEQIPDIVGYVFASLLATLEQRRVLDGEGKPTPVGVLSVK